MALTGFGMWLMFALWMFSGNHYIVGLVAVSIGCYTICMDCGYVLSSVQDVS